MDTSRDRTSVSSRGVGNPPPGGGGGIVPLPFSGCCSFCLFPVDNVKIRRPPNAKATLCFLLLVTSFNFFFDRIEHHMVFLSTTIYTNSAIYEPHTAVSLINAEDYGWGRAPLRLRRALVCTASNGTHTKVSRAQIRWAYQPVGICKWTAYIGICQTLPNLVELSLSDTSVNSQPVNIPFRLAFSTRRLNVAACFSPLFYMERWQIIFYIQSILASIMDVIELYRKAGIVELEPWPSIELDEQSEVRVGFDPNIELDWRNQASAHTDCLLKYREATMFIIVGDLDDVLIPRLGSRYIDEFRLLSSVYPNAAGFTYNRFNTELESGSQVRDYSLARLVESAHISDQNETGKYVINTSRVETAWLHYPGIKLGWVKMFTVPTDLNIMVHLRNWTIDERIDSKANLLRRRRRRRRRKRTEPIDWGDESLRLPGGHASRLSELMSARQLARMESAFVRMLSSHGETFRRLPTAQHYLPMMVDCYNRIFYSQKNRKPNFCPGPVKCMLPQISGLHCKVAKMRMAKPRQISWRIIVHVPKNEFEFVSRLDGCSLR
uniref:Glycosyltransferase family 92 protein n=1 Tax=Globodera rostochiensis TaxID=31243 RepID=A0A914GTN3_GLORO